MNNVNTNFKYLPKFLNDDQFSIPSDPYNGLCIDNTYIPEEVMLHLLSFIEPKKLLSYSLVCHNWNRLIKSHALWSKIYIRNYNRKVADLPWYLYYCLLSTNYFDTNLLINEKGENAFIYTQLNVCIRRNSSVVADSLLTAKDESEDLNLQALIIKTHHRIQPILNCRPCPNFYEEQSVLKLNKNKLFNYILDNYKPHIYIWNCGDIKGLQFRYIEDVWPKDALFIADVAGGEPGLIISEYPEGVGGLVFEESRSSLRRCSTLYEGVLKFVFDSIKPVSVDAHGNKQPNKFSKFVFKTLTEGE